jgi:hypothetical protein
MSSDTIIQRAVIGIAHPIIPAENEPSTFISPLLAKVSAAPGSWIRKRLDARHFRDVWDYRDPLAHSRNPAAQATIESLAQLSGSAHQSRRGGNRSSRYPLARTTKSDTITDNTSAVVAVIQFPCSPMSIRPRQ